MYKQSPVLLLILLTLIFSPTLASWVLSTDGVWYRPYIVWLIIIIITYFVQRAALKHHDS